MAYLLLWSAIERFATFRYHLGDKPWHKVQQLADEPSFREAVRELVATGAQVQRADHPSRTVHLNPEKPESIVAYFYQLRSNIAHRGKGIPHDFDRLHVALGQLLAIFRHVVAQSFGSHTDGGITKPI
jgi:hypothetical protein